MGKFKEMYKEFNIWFDKNFVNTRMVAFLFIFTLAYGWAFK